MSQRELLLLSPYRMPAQNSLALGDDDVASFLNGYTALWHPAARGGAAAPPRIASPYDFEQPGAGHIYALPESPPLILPDDWMERVKEVGAIAFHAGPDRETTFANLKAALREKNPDPRCLELLDLPRERVAPFLGLGFGYVILDTLFEAMEHENLIAHVELWNEVQAAATGDDAATHLQAAADLLTQARDVLYPVAIHLLDIALLDDKNLDRPFPATYEHKLGVNLIASVALLEKLSREQPERFVALKERVQADQVELCSGAYLERADALLPLESQLWNLLKGTRVFKELFGQDVRVHGRKRFAAHPQLPLLLNNVGINRTLLLAFDASVLPNWRSTVTNWPAPDGKQVEAFTRTPYEAHSPQTFFNLAHYLQRTIRQDQAATLALLHTDKPASPFYEDWLELSKFGPVLGQWVPFSRYFNEAMAGEYASAANADDFHSDYLEEGTDAGLTHPVSGFAHHLRTRRRFDTLHTLAAFYRGLAGANDTLGLDGRFPELEDRLEAGDDVTISLDEVQTQVGAALSQRLLSRATSDRPGFLVFNPCGFTRRLALEIDGMSGALAVEGPVKAYQLDGAQGKLVVEVPALGFAWFPRHGPAGSKGPPPGKIKLADGNAIRNEFFEADVDPLTGGLRGLRDHKTRINRIGQQLVWNPGSSMRASEVKVTSAGPALGEIVSTGTLVDEHRQVVATFRQRFRAWAGRPVLDLRVEIVPETMPTGYPWHSYFGARFAPRDERATLLRGVNGTGYVSNHTRPESPDYLELRIGRSNTTLLPGGLPFHQKHGSRFIDIILLPQGEQARAFDLAIGIDRDHPTQTALGLATPVPVIPTTNGPPHIGAAGWLFHLDATNLLLTSFRPAPDKADALLARMIETSTHGGAAEFRCVRNPTRGSFLDARGTLLQETGLSGDAVLFEASPCDLVQLRIDFS